MRNAGQWLYDCLCVALTVHQKYWLRHAMQTGLQSAGLLYASSFPAKYFTLRMLSTSCKHLLSDSVLDLWCDSALHMYKNTPRDYDSDQWDFYCTQLFAFCSTLFGQSTKSTAMIHVTCRIIDQRFVVAVWLMGVHRLWINRRNVLHVLLMYPSSFHLPTLSSPNLCH